MNLKIKIKNNIFIPDILLSYIYNYLHESFYKMNEKSKCNKKAKYVKKHR